MRLKNVKNRIILVSSWQRLFGWALREMAVLLLFARWFNGFGLALCRRDESEQRVGGIWQALNGLAGASKSSLAFEHADPSNFAEASSPAVRGLAQTAETKDGAKESATRGWARGFHTM